MERVMREILILSVEDKRHEIVNIPGETKYLQPPRLTPAKHRPGTTVMRKLPLESKISSLAPFYNGDYIDICQRTTRTETLEALRKIKM